MKKHAKATFTITAWDEKPYNEINGGPKLTRASVIKSYQGDITGAGKLEYLMMYREDGSASFTGLERLEGGWPIVRGALCSSIAAHSKTALLRSPWLSFLTPELENYAGCEEVENLLLVINSPTR